MTRFLLLFTLCITTIFCSCKNEKQEEDRFADKPKIASKRMMVVDTIFFKKPRPNGKTFRVKRKKETVFTIPNQLPVFKGCGTLATLEERYSCSNKRVLQYVANNIQYPKEAFENGIEGTSLVSFIIDENGKVINEKIEKSIGYGTDQEVLSMVAKMRKQNIRWIPGIVKGEKVKVLQTLPVNFTLH